MNKIKYIKEDSIMKVDTYLYNAVKCRFDKITNGDIFLFDNDYYIKVDMNACTEHEVNAICLTKFCKTTYFSRYTEVYYNKDYQTIKICNRNTE